MHQTVRKSHVLLICLALVLAGLIAFEQLRNCEFVNYDDDKYVTDNPHVQVGLNPDSVFWAFTNPHYHMWHPMTSLSYMLDYQISGLNAGRYHMTNLLLHLANTLLLFLILKKMTGALWPSAFVAAAFALHPLHVESVAWISERKDVLSAFFWMLTIAAYLRYSQQPGISSYLLVVVVFSLALMSKPMVVTLPFVLLLLDYWPLDRFQWPRQNESADLPRFESPEITYQKSSLWYLICEKIPLLILSAAMCVITFLAQQSGDVVLSFESVPLILRVTNAVISYLMYIEKMIWPSGLAVLYPYRLGVFEAVAGLLLLLVVSIQVVRRRQTHRYLLVGWLWYLGTLLPVIGLVQAGTQAMADRYTYLPSIGIFIIVAFGATELAAKWQYLNRPIAISAVVLLAVFMICTHRQVRYWQNNLTLFGHAVEVTEGNYVIHNNYGAELSRKGRFDDAVKHLNEALRINPQYFSALRNLGRVYSEQHKIEQAVYYWNKALKIEPESVGIMNNLAMIFATHNRAELRDPKRAVRLAERACQLTQYSRPDCVGTLAVAYDAAGRYLKAVEAAEKALKLATSAGEIDLCRQIQKTLESYKAKLSNHKPQPTEAE